MKKVQSMLVLSDAISKGAKPFLTKEGQAYIAAVINGKVEIKDEEVKGA